MQRTGHFFVQQHLISSADQLQKHFMALCDCCSHRYQTCCTCICQTSCSHNHQTCYSHCYQTCYRDYYRTWCSYSSAGGCRWGVWGTCASTPAGGLGPCDCCNEGSHSTAGDGGHHEVQEVQIYACLHSTVKQSLKMGDQPG